MARTLVKSTKEFNQNSVPFARQIESRKKLAYLSLIISLFFAVFWLPSHVYSMIYQFLPAEMYKVGEIIKFRHFHYYMALANSSVNPWLIFTLSSSHRNCLRRCLGCKKMNRDGNSANTLRVVRNSLPLRACGTPERNLATEHRKHYYTRIG